MKEFRNLKKAEEAGVRAPQPIAIEHNVLVMSFIGDGDDAAPRLSDCGAEDPEKTFKDIVLQMCKMYKAGLVHADLSEYNVLMWEGKPYLIDFGQGVLLTHPKAAEFLERDVKNICWYFKRRGVKCDPEAVVKKIMACRKAKDG
jgi:RIO kinase 1